MLTSDMPGGRGSLTAGSRRRVSAVPDSDSAYEETSYHIVEVSDKGRRLVVYVFTAFIITLFAPAIPMISATLSFGSGATGST
jgi:hypothetical protein